MPERHEPDIGELNYPYLFALIDALGYDGWIGCEYRPKAGTSEALPAGSSRTCNSSILPRVKNMKVLITGGAGFGHRLARKLLERGELTGPDGRSEKIDELVLLDVVAGSDFGDARVTSIVGDIAERAVLDRAIDTQTGAIFHPRRSSAGRPKPISISACGSTSTRRARCSKYAARVAIGRASCSRAPSQSMAARCPTSCRTTPR